MFQILAITALAGLAVWLAFGLVSGVMLFRGLVRHQTFTPEHTLADGIKKGEIPPDFPFNSFTDFTIPSPRGYSLRGVIRHSPAATAEDVVIFSHGVSWTWHGMIKYMPMFMQRDWTIVAYDHYAHGRTNGDKTISYGFYEKHDLAAIVRWVQANCTEAKRLWLFGESMGAAIVLQALPLVEDAVHAVIVDSPFTRLTTLGRYHLKRRRIPTPAHGLALACADWLARTQASFSFAQVNPINELAKVNLPVFLAHGLADETVPPAMAREYANRFASRLQLHLQARASHAQSIITNSNEYNRLVAKFINEPFRNQ